MRTYTFVTVVFEAEYPLLALQAVSMARFLHPDLVEQIVVLANPLTSGLNRKLERLPEKLGLLAEKLKVVDSRALFNGTGISGWRSQQIGKLLIASQIKSERYVILDAKTHLVGRLNEGYLANPDGRALIKVYPYTRHTLRHSLSSTLSFLGLDPGDHLGEFPASVPPIVLYTNEVKNLVDFIEKQYETTFAAAFEAHELLEFFLYFGWLTRNGQRFDKLYASTHRLNPVIWENTTDPKSVGDLIEQAVASGSPFFSLHRRAAARAPGSSRRLIAAYWHSSGLFASQGEAMEFLEQFVRDYRLGYWSERVSRKFQQLSARLRALNLLNIGFGRQRA